MHVDSEGVGQCPRSPGITIVVNRKAVPVLACPLCKDGPSMAMGTAERAQGRSALPLVIIECTADPARVHMRVDRGPEGEYTDATDAQA